MSGFDFRLLLFVSTFNQLLDVPFLDDILPSEAAVSSGFCVNVLLNRSDVDFLLLRKVLLLCMFIHV